MTQWYLDPVGNYWVASILALALLLMLATVGLRASQLSRRRRSVLIGLRVAVLVLFLIALLRPALVHIETKRQPATLVLLADRSRSMTVTDAFGGRSRWDALRATLSEALPTLRSLTKDLQVKVFTFDADVRPIEFDGRTLDVGSVADGAQTAIGSALEEILRRESGQRVAGIVLLTDGAQRAFAPKDIPPQAPARRLADLGYPLFALPFGQSRDLGQARDVAVKDLITSSSVYVKNELVVQGSIRIDGFAKQSIPVQLWFESPAGKMELVATQEVLPTPGQVIPITLSTRPQTPGEYKLTLRAVAQPGELVTTNNELSTFVTVLKGGLNVLYLEGALRVEPKFLALALDSSQDIKLDYVRLEANNLDSRPPDLLARLTRGKYDVYILGDVDSSQLTKEELAALAQSVKQGAGLIMIGGYHSFGPGGYAETPLAPLLPVRMAAIERQRPGDKIRDDMHLKGSVKMRPAAPLGTRHFVMSLDAGSNNADAWGKLPPLEGANRLGEPKPGTQVLAESTNGRPLLVAHEAGGRVMAFAGDTTWHWWMEGHDAEHKRFWRQVVLWLAHKDELAEGTVWIKLAQRRYAPGGRVSFTVGANSPHGDPVKNASYEIEVVSPDKTRTPVRAIQQGDSASGTFTETHLAGDYAMTVTAKGSDGQSLGAAKARFLVFEQDLELDNAAADPTLLASLAAMTRDVGGQTIAPEELPELLERIRTQPQLTIQTEVKRTPWDTWPFFATFVGLLSVEWYLRKRWGLV